MESARITLPRSGQNSATATPKPGSDTKQASKDIRTTLPTHNSHYTVFIRLPFPRNDFQDPPPVEWDAIKDKALWKLISTASNSKEINWEEMSTRFNVSLGFLLQQAAWLYERHFEGMRMQMRRLGVPSAAASGTATPASAAPATLEAGGGVRVDAGGVGMSRTGSKDSRPTTSAAMQRRSSLQHGEPDSNPATPRSKHAFSRTPSTNTVTQSRFPTSPRQPNRSTSGAVGKQAAPSLLKESSQDSSKAAGPGVDGLSDSESEQETSVIRSQAFRRPPSKKPPIQEAASDADADEDGEDDSSGGSLPFAASRNLSSDDPAATLRNSPNSKNATPMLTSPSKAKAKVPPPPPPPPPATVDPTGQRPATSKNQTSANHRSEPLSPKQRAELEKLSPRYKKPGSESSPSIGSSFSDLDDASVTQSALEEALLSNMQYGSIGMGVGSRMSSLRDALGRQG